MDPAIRQGFAIGLVLAIAAGYFGWREGWWPSQGVKSAIEDAAPSDKAAPPAPKPDAERPDRQAAVPNAPESPAPKAPESPAPNSESPAAKPESPGPPSIATLTPPEVTPAPAPKQAAADKGAFDVVRVEPTGEAVVAGRCTGECVVELTTDGRTHDKAKADGSGAWAMTPPPLPPGDHVLGLKVTTPDGKVATSEQSVTVSVPETPKGEVVVVLNEPNAPSKILQRPGQAPATVAAAPAAASPGATQTPSRAAANVSIGAVDAEKGRLFVQGAAPADAALRVYLNNALIARPIAGRDERWSVRVERGLTPGDYVVRVDHVRPPSGKVLARAETRFSYQGEAAEAEPKVAARTEPKAAPPTVDRPATQNAPPSARPPAPQSAPPPAPQAAPQPEAAPAPEAAAQVSPPRPEAAPQEPPARAEPAAPPADAPDVARDGSANAVVPSIDTANVRRGDSLWRISRKTYGSGARYTVIFTANDQQIRNPDLIYPGQLLVLPEDPEKATAR